MSSFRRVHQAARQNLRGTLSPLILKAIGRVFKPEETIVISGYFRSGTTWLAELISKAVNGGIVFEPLHTDQVPQAKAVGFSYNNFRQFDEDWPEGREFVGRVLRGKVLNRWTAGHISLDRAFQVQRLVVKLVASNQMLVWLAENFDVPKPLLIIRHPCAVLASWLNRGWRLNSWIMKDQGVLACHPEIEHILATLSYDEEYFAAKWCVDHYVPLSCAKRDKFQIVPFEKLTLCGAGYLEEILKNWQMSLPDLVRKEFRRPSEKASKDLSNNYGSVSSGWRKSLTAVQQERVLRVVRDFGLDFYTADLEPDYVRLLGPNPVGRI